MRIRHATPVFLLILGSPGLQANVRCPAIFSDHMVLQAGRSVALWGEASPGEHVTVEFGGRAAKASAGADGRWRAVLPPMQPSADGRTLTVRGENKLVFSDVLVGEVWLCSGQSNMEKPLGPRKGQKPTDDFQDEIREAGHPLIRLYQVPWHGKPRKKQVGLTWVPCTPNTIVETQFSAAAYYFGRELRRELRVPVGLVHSSFGGTQIEAWIPGAAFSDHPAIRALRNVTYAAWVKGVQATELFDSMIAPLVPYTVRGILWYQGESNVMQADGSIYTDKMRALIDGWRSAWGDPNLPWFYVQVAPFDYSRWDSFPKRVTAQELPVFWEAQTAALAIPHTGMVVTTDLVTNVRDIHPTDKRDVGIRLARLALAETYGRRDVAARSPRFSAVEREGGRLAVDFMDVGAGLRTRDGKPADDFTVAGSDRKFAPAAAAIEGGRVVVWSPAVPLPVAVRFGWTETATPNLENSAGLPAIPFRTDRWPVNVLRPAAEPGLRPASRRR